MIKIIDEKVQNYRNELSKKNGTYSEGFNISGTPNIWQFDGMICFSRDYKGNMGIQITGSGGVTVGTPSISISKYVSRTNAPDISFFGRERCFYWRFCISANTSSSVCWCWWRI